MSEFLKVLDNRGARLSLQTSEWDLSGGLSTYDQGRSQKWKMNLERVGEKNAERGRGEKEGEADRGREK